MLPAPPASRRLRIFATDPGASIELNTAFINEATVEVPWETARSAENLLTPGPVGEYVEVVDVDPASARVYDPVDLNNPYLLAQDGLSPSEGNPQFHQQMVYAVAFGSRRCPVSEGSSKPTDRDATRGTDGGSNRSLPSAEF